MRAFRLTMFCLNILFGLLNLYFLLPPHPSLWNGVIGVFNLLVAYNVFCDLRKSADVGR